MALTMNLTNVQREAPTFKTATGEIVTLTDAKGEQYFRELQTTIEPVQDLHGYDNPWPAGGGKNKIDANNVSVIANTDNQYLVTDGTVTLPAGTYTLSFTVGATVTSTRNRPMYLVDSTPTYANSDYNTQGRQSWTFTLSEETTMQFKWLGHTLSANCVISDFMLEAGSSATAFAPYENICPISGFSEAKVTRAGKNLIDLSSLRGGGFDIAANLPAGNICTNDYVPIKGGQTYLWSQKRYPASGGRYVRWYDNNKVMIGSTVSIYSDSPSSISAPNDACFVRFIWYQPTYWRSVDEVIADEPMFELGSTATAYEPYNGTTFTISLGSTRYGGTLDVRRGKLRVTHKYWTSQGTVKTDWISSGGGGYYTQKNYGLDSLAYSDDGYCNMFIFKYSFGQTNGIMAYANRIQVSKSSFSTLDEFVDAITATPIQLVYPLATPIEVDLTPIEITTLLGINNVWADTGEVTVTYKVDPNAEPTLTLASPLRTNLGGLRPIVPEAEEIIAESEDPENGANLTTESEVQNGET